MAKKLGHQQGPDPIDGKDLVTKEYGDANYIQTPGGGAADALATTGADVNVSASDPPTAGQALVADSATTATWQDVAAGSTANAAAQGAFIQKSMSASQASITAGTVYALDTVERKTGDLSSSGNQFVGLAAGRTYLLIAHIRTTVQWQSIQWYDVTGASYLGEDGTVVDPSGQETGTVTTIFKPEVDSTVELRALLTGGSATTDGYGCVGTIVEIGAVQADVVGGLEFMDIINVSVATPLISFGADGDGLYQRAMDGNLDETYVLDFGLFADASNDFSIRPNGVTANQEGRRYTAGSSVSGDLPYMVIGEPSVGDKIEGTLELRAAVTRGGVAQSRTYRSSHSWFDTSGNTTYARGAAGRWDNTVDNIVSLDVAVETSGNFEPGSYAILWRKTRTNLRADSAAVYERMVLETVDPSNIATTERTTGHSVYGGSVVGLSLRIEDAVTAGSITVNVKVEGVGTVLTAVLDTTNSTSKVERLPIGQAKFAADKNISVEVVPSSYDNAGSVASPVTVQVHMTNDALITQNDRVVAKTVLSANATTLSVTGLDGDNDGTYEIEGTIFLTNSANNLLIAPNGDTSNMHARQGANNGTTTSVDGKVVISGAVTSRNEFAFKCLAYVARTKNGTTRIRSFQFTASHLYDSGPNVNTHTAVVAYEDAAANLASLDFTCSVASGILAGSEVTVRRVKA